MRGDYECLFEYFEKLEKLTSDCMEEQVGLLSNKCNIYGFMRLGNKYIL